MTEEEKTKIAELAYRKFVLSLNSLSTKQRRQFEKNMGKIEAEELKKNRKKLGLD